MFGWSFGALVKALGNVAFLNVGKSANTIASGDDTRIVNSLDRTLNLWDIPNKDAAIINLDGFRLRGDLKDTNLNTIGLPSATGLWFQPTPKGTNLAYPEDRSAGSLLVLKAGNTSTSHIFTNWSNGNSWVRTWDGSKWTPWSLKLIHSKNLSDVSSGWNSIRNLGGVHFGGNLLNKDLNIYNGTERGVYYQRVSADATPDRNYPARIAGVLVVLQNSANKPSGCVQTYYAFDSHGTYKRRFDAWNGVWTPWYNVLLDVTNLMEVRDKAEARKNLEIYSAVYPIGSVIKFDNNANPNTSFPGTTWTEIRDGRIIRSSPNGATNSFGSDSFTLTDANIPKHTHTISGTVSSAGEHTHWDGWNAPGNTPWDERLPNESEYDAYMRLTGRWSESSGTDNQGRHNRRWTSQDGAHTHPISITCSEAYPGATQAVNFPMTSKYYRVWKRTA